MAPGSASISAAVASTTSVSNRTIRVEMLGSDAITAPAMPACTTDEAIEPDWSTHRMTSRSAWRWRLLPTRDSGMMVPSEGW